MYGNSHDSVNFAIQFALDFLYFLYVRIEMHDFECMSFIQCVSAVSTAYLLRVGKCERERENQKKNLAILQLLKIKTQK